ncbi:MAG: hypothetical protein Q8L81_16580, partial [Bacteroidota bacterium]|nr:hypothetical protein [Bacteroidota bacterium]
MKYNLNSETSSEVMQKLDGQVKDTLLGCPLPKAYKNLRTIGGARFKFSFHSEINWLVLSLQFFNKEVNLFLEYEKEFETNFLIGNYVKAKEVIDKIDSKICVSQWSIEKRLLVAEYSKDDNETKKDIIDRIKHEADRLIKINCSYTSIRYETQLPPNRYEEILEKFVNRQRTSGMSRYFLF